jgi:DeoR/GlpR family transcriptional regulator of sugar metabolism
VNIAHVRSHKCRGRLSRVNADERLISLVHQLQADGRIDVAQAAAMHGTADMTIRRDLDVLVQRGVARRVRGGAVSLLPRGDEIPYWMRELESAEAKARIGEAAASLLRDGDAVALDSGTTTLQVARALAGRRLTVTAVALPTAAALAEHSSIRLILPGGEVRPGELALTGAVTVAAIERLRFDAVVLGACGLAGATVTAYDLGDGAVKRAMIQSSARVIVVADAAKLHRSGMAVVCGAREIDALVTDRDVPAAELAPWREAGVEVLGV